MTVIGTARERLLRALRGERVDRAPVICPGGMMTMATRSAMCASGAAWPRAHSDPHAMADLVRATQAETDLECLAAPFCMTVEAEALGCRVDLGADNALPHVEAEAFADPAGLERLPAFDAERSGRAPVVLAALRLLAAGRSGEPVIGAVVGPVSLAAMVMEAGVFLRLARRDPPRAQEIVAAMARVTLAFAVAQRAAGADCVMIAEPTATGEVLGARHFTHLALPALTRLLSVLRDSDAAAILHICGDVRPLLSALRVLARRLPPLALSVDSMVSGELLRRELPGCVRVGNVDALLLERGPVSAIERAARRAARDFDVVSPACGLAPTTPASHLRALVHASRDHERT
ncbi:MAG TPA: uroporphyrinogen decarboxylase family protein [Armatimonadota bacterium]|nr:uroporphyrinogen decarboxylase family protein [Armatimonadota bacterium]